MFMNEHRLRTRDENEVVHFTIHLSLTEPPMRELLRSREAELAGPPSILSFFESRWRQFLGGDRIPPLGHKVKEK